MEQSIRTEIMNFVREAAGSRQNGGFPCFEEPLVGFASADDPLFTSYKEIIVPFHLTPQELIDFEFGREARAGAVICWVLPVHRTARESNRRQEKLPSREWSHVRHFGEAFNGSLRRHMVDWLTGRGYLALAPQFSKAWREVTDSAVGIASTWSERHAAYAAGLGTFSLSDGFITARGIAHRLGSVIVDLQLRPSPRDATDYRNNCLFYREVSCGICIDRCPIGAITAKGHDKSACGKYVYQTVPRAVAAEYGVTATGCGLCQTKVPCEAMIPAGREVAVRQEM